MHPQSETNRHSYRDTQAETDLRATSDTNCDPTAHTRSDRDSAPDGHTSSDCYATPHGDTQANGDSGSLLLRTELKKDERSAHLLSSFLMSGVFGCLINWN
jgi:hypothetical protein